MTVTQIYTQTPGTLHDHHMTIIIMSHNTNSSICTLEPNHTGLGVPVPPTYDLTSKLGWDFWEQMLVLQPTNQAHMVSGTVT